MYRLALLALAATMLFAGNALAQQASIPPTLKAWEPWVMYGEEYRRCPLRNGVAPGNSTGFECRWPGRLRLSVADGGGEFAQGWQLYADEWITLPGDETHWPEDVRVNGVPTAVSAHAGSPRIRLPSGDHQVTGRFTWSRRPESLHVAAATALVDLSHRWQAHRSGRPAQRSPVAWRCTLRGAATCAGGAGLSTSPGRQSDATWSRSCI